MKKRKNLQEDDLIFEKVLLVVMLLCPLILILFAIPFKQENYNVSAIVEEKVFTQGYVSPRGSYIEPQYYIKVKYNDMEANYKSKKMFESVEEGEDIAMEVHKEYSVFGGCKKNLLNQNGQDKLKLSK